MFEQLEFSGHVGVTHLPGLDWQPIIKQVGKKLSSFLKITNQQLKCLSEILFLGFPQRPGKLQAKRFVVACHSSTAKHRQENHQLLLW